MSIKITRCVIASDRRERGNPSILTGILDCFASRCSARNDASGNFCPSVVSHALCWETFLKFFPIIIISLLLTSCGLTDWMGASEAPPLPGTRVPAIQSAGDVNGEYAPVGGSVIQVPDSIANEMWPQAGGYPNHAMGNLALASNPSVLWTADIGSGASAVNKLFPRPIVAEGRVFAMDLEYQVSAFDAETGKRLWQQNVQPEKEGGGAIGGGLAYADHSITVTTGFGEVVRLNADDGHIMWRKNVASPIGGAAAVASGKVFVITNDNRLIVLSLENGTTAWTHRGMADSLGIVGGSSPAVSEGIVIAPYSSGELYALMPENGREMWVVNMGERSAIGQSGNVSGIRGLPVISGGLIFASDHSGQTVAIDARTGRKIWERSLGSLNDPLLVGRWLYLMTNENRLVALSALSGMIAWEKQFERWENPKDHTHSILISGPVMGGSLLWLVTSEGHLIAVDPTDGSVEQTINLPGDVYQPAIIANRTMYVVTEGADLVAMR